MRSTFTCLCVAIFILSGCTKQMTDAPANESQTDDKVSVPSLQALTTDKGWYGYYAGADVFNSDTLYAADIIKGGVAQMPFYSNSRDVFTGIDYDIPTKHIINGDSVVYEVQIQNPKDGYHSDWDVAIDIKGTKHEAHVDFVADSIYSQYTTFFVGDAVVNGIPSLVHDFETFATLRLTLKNNKASIKLNGKLLFAFAYGAKNRIGQIKTISFGGKGYMSCTSVKLANSYTGKLILTENFNTDGQSTIVYH